MRRLLPSLRLVTVTRMTLSQVRSLLLLGELVLRELGQVRLLYVFLAFIKLLSLIVIKLLMFLMFSFMPDAIVEPDAL